MLAVMTAPAFARLLPARPLWKMPPWMKRARDSASITTLKRRALQYRQEFHFTGEARA
jgi:hypothetical protein